MSGKDEDSNKRSAKKGIVSKSSYNNSPLKLEDGGKKRKCSIEQCKRFVIRSQTINSRLSKFLSMVKIEGTEKNSSNFNHVAVLINVIKLVLEGNTEFCYLHSEVSCIFQESLQQLEDETLSSVNQLSVLIKEQLESATECFKPSKAVTISISGKIPKLEIDQCKETDIGIFGEAQRDRREVSSQSLQHQNENESIRKELRLEKEKRKRLTGVIRKLSCKLREKNGLLKALQQNRKNSLL